MLEGKKDEQYEMEIYLLIHMQQVVDNDNRDQV